jgi:hypothetical protein
MEMLIPVNVEQSPINPQVMAFGNVETKAVNISIAGWFSGSKI